MANKYGFTSVNQQVTSGGNSQTDLISRLNEINNKLIYARVTDIILDDNHPYFNDYGKWSSIGTIFFESTEGSSLTYTTNPYALPLYPNHKNYPVVNELVLLFLLPNKNIIEQNNSTNYYYINPISIWNHPNLNAYPNVLKQPQVQDTQNKSYQAIEDGQTRKVSDEEVGFEYNSPLIGGTFVPNATIRPLLSFAGDIITEGRWGNSVRFGSTANNTSSTSLPQNNWSSQGANGEPITIIRNGQPLSASIEDGWVPIVENINEDKSSIYLTSNQAIPLITQFNSYPTISNGIPEAIGSFSGSQVIINTDRLVFNTKADSLIINSQNSIAVSSINDIGVYSKKGNVNIQGQNVRLGDVNASQALVLGDKFMDDFGNLLKRLQLLCNALGSEPYLTISTPPANSVQSQVEDMIDSLKNYTSKVSKTV